MPHLIAVRTVAPGLEVELESRLDLIGEIHQLLNFQVGSTGVVLPRLDQARRET